MDSFETVIAMLLTRCGYWSITSYRVILTPEEKRKSERPSNPRVECKSFLDSRGVLFRNKKFEHPTRYKLFSDETLRDVILRRLAIQLEECGLCRSKPTVKLCLAAGRIANQTDRKDMNEWFAANAGSKVIHSVIALHPLPGGALATGGFAEVHPRHRPGPGFLHISAILAVGPLAHRLAAVADNRLKWIALRSAHTQPF